MVFAVLMAITSRFWFFPFLTLIECVIIGIILACLGLLGDLAESSFKRTSGVKDSGSIIPGHGGMLDRLDSLLFTGTWVLLCSLIHHESGRSLRNAPSSISTEQFKIRNLYDEHVRKEKSHLDVLAST